MENCNIKGKKPDYNEQGQTANWSLQNVLSLRTSQKKVMDWKENKWISFETI